jgi:hypothetical protein
MRHLKLLLTMVMAIAAITSIAATTASAEEGLLPIGSTFTGKGPAGTLETAGGSIVNCGGFTLKGGEATSNESGKIANIDFEKCKAVFFTANSLGDAEGTILVDGASVLICLITPAAKVFGVLLKLKEAVHLEVPAVGALIKISGTVIGKIEPNASGTEKKVTFEQAKGVQKPTECTNLLTGKVEKDELKFELDGGKPESSGINQTASLTFNKAVELMDK